MKKMGCTTGLQCKVHSSPTFVGEDAITWTKFTERVVSICPRQANGGHQMPEEAEFMDVSKSTGLCQSCARAVYRNSFRFYNYESCFSIVCTRTHTSHITHDTSHMTHHTSTKK